MGFYLVAVEGGKLSNVASASPWKWRQLDHSRILAEGKSGLCEANQIRAITRPNTHTGQNLRLKKIHM